MPSPGSYRNFKEEQNVSFSILAFSKFLRSRDFLVGYDASIEAQKAVALGALTDKELLRYALKPIFCGSYEDSSQFDKLFDAYFKLQILMFKNKTTFHNQQRTNPIASAVMLGFGEGQSDDDEETKTTSGGNNEERLRATDFAKVSNIESDELDDLAKRLWKEMSLRLKKRYRQSLNKGSIDIRKSIRSNASNGFEMLKLIRKNKKPQKHKLILLLDVSGSMDKYSFYLLRFMWCLKNHFRAIECFIFSTRIMRITEMIDRKDLQFSLDALKHNVNVWGSGTKIGECLKVYNQSFAKQCMQSKNITLILSDGLDTGEPDLLVDEIRKIKRKTSKLVWLNPLKGMQGYEPSQKAMQAVIEDLDVFRAANNLNSLLELENILINV